MSGSEIPFQLVVFNESVFCGSSEEGFYRDLLISYHIFCIVIGAINAILNGICVHIFEHPAWKRSAMSRILKGLSVIELCMGISLFAHAIMNIISFEEELIYRKHIENYHSTNNSSKFSITDRNRTYVQSIAKFVFSRLFGLCLLAFQIARNWSVVILAAYRYDRVCRPIGTRTALPRERIRCILITVTILACCIVLPRAIEFKIILCSVSGILVNDMAYLLTRHEYQIVYLGLVMFFVQSGGPVICVCVLSTFVIRLIAKRRKIHRINEQKSARHILNQQQAQRMDGESEQASQILPRQSLIDKTKTDCPMELTPTERPSPSGDKLIFAMCITFFVLETPAFFSKILNYYLQQSYQVVDQIFSVIANILIYLDSTLNAFVYMASNPTFRKIAANEMVRYRRRLSRYQATTNMLSNNATQFMLRNIETTVIEE
ncbi:hypothetical protein PHET_04910 [Paragonimus heterotremus]|uniref:G-protein coupled receptors family 1 profile domain-containing protein n=1 Tax=Paragonimus heterotremus TaxID=100268 RepID=A0A8J4WIB2_9TREM|nr:hypothetical protein PHET_04910 [Paragonimus heterotremus]